MTLASRPPRGERGVCNEGEITEFIRHGRQSLLDPILCLYGLILCQLAGHARCMQDSEHQHKQGFAAGEDLMRSELNLHLAGYLLWLLL